MNKRTVGNIQEDLAVKFLTAHGVIILERNFHDGRAGEIDIIGRDAQTLIFVEVKYRSSTRCGRPEEAVTLRKQQTISKVACYYLYKHHQSSVPVRFDVVAIFRVDAQKVYIRWIKDAFPFRQYGQYRY